MDDKSSAAPLFDMFRVDQPCKGAFLLAELEQEANCQGNIHAIEMANVFNIGGKVLVSVFPLWSVKLATMAETGSRRWYSCALF